MQHSNSTKITDELATMLSENQQLLNELDALMKENVTAESVVNKPVVDEKTVSLQTSETIDSNEEKNVPNIDFRQLQNLIMNSPSDKSSENELNEIIKTKDNLNGDRDESLLELKQKNSKNDSFNSDEYLIESSVTPTSIDRGSNCETEAIDSLITRESYHYSDEELINEKDLFKQDPNQENKIYDETWLTITTILIGLWLFFWLNQNSINTYFQQKYHHSSPLEIFDSLTVWDVGQIINDKSVEMLNTLFMNESNENAELTSDNVILEKDNDIIESQSKQITLAVLPLIYSTNDETKQLTKSITYKLEESPLENAYTLNGKVDDPLTNERTFQLRSIEQLSMGDDINSPRYGYLLKEGEKVFFAGDSLMQGVAPHVINKLKKEFNTSSINLSKQSTGLTYPKAYDWPKAIEKTLRENDDIGLLVMMLGANDPWDMQVKKGQPYLRFGSELWNQEYQSRIDTIYQLAASKGIGVIWISAPSMKKSNLNKGVLHLDTLYKQVSEHYGGIFLDSNIMFGYESDIYNAYATWNEKNSKIRADDGVHFTPTGQKIIAEYVLSVIGVLKQTSADEVAAP